MSTELLAQIADHLAVVAADQRYRKAPGRVPRPSLLTRGPAGDRAPRTGAAHAVAVLAATRRPPGHA